MSAFTESVESLNFITEMTVECGGKTVAAEPNTENVPLSYDVAAALDSSLLPQTSDATGRALPFFPVDAKSIKSSPPATL
ncbi:hypothetical protein JOB18_012831 [Solea senegalensis]|uniref:Uncharacterized protein n=1 Tax=Solea senegalensis TaxID=28829 RepID=A0AAV6S2X5_SOLSE|nr:hypothetical protein JOB18_012831 [Solea senegalensis]